jgi:ABC-type long-subunit fatty acid transport system fused permease/ATPase subunit
VDPAWIAVFGTLSGVVVSTVGGITTSSLTSRNQRLASQRQLESAADDKIRQEVRESFVDYLSAYTALRDESSYSGTSAAKPPRPPC